MGSKRKIREIWQMLMRDPFSEAMKSGPTIRMEGCTFTDCVFVGDEDEADTTDDPNGVFADDDAIGDAEPVHDIIWAARQMQDGKRVRRNGWRGGADWGIEFNPPFPMKIDFDGDSGYGANIIDNLLATDWEVVES